MDIFALDKDFNVITVAIPYKTLTWTRRYYTAGKFSMTIAEEIYDTNWAYIGTPDRPELGMVDKLVTYSEGFIVSGFFCEGMLNECVCYPRYVGDVSKTEQAVRNIFSKYGSRLPIELAPPNDPLMGDRTQSDFVDDFLGVKMASILESRELAYRVRYDYELSKLLLEVWQGLDRTQSQNENSYQVFSTEYGNILDREANFDSSDYKNYAIIPCNANDDGVEQDTFYLDWTNGERRRDIVYDMRSKKPEEGQSAEAFKQAILQEATEKLLTRQKITDIDIQPTDGYLETFDLGDKCDVLLTDLQIEMETRIVEIVETMNDYDGHKVTVGLGNKRITNIRRAVNA